MDDTDGEQTDDDRSIVESTAGVTLTKQFETEEYVQPAVVYELDSDRDDPATVRVIETMPDGLAPTDIGFLDASKSSAWTVKGPKLVLETDVGAGADFTTVCGARGGNVEALSDLLDRPDAFEVEPHGSGETEDPDSDTEAESFTRSAGTAGSLTEELAPDDGPQSTDRDLVVERLVEELRADEVSPESVEFLREELGPAGDARPRSVEARLKQLQTDISDVRAYTNALEAFLDENGSAQELIDRFQRRVGSLEDALEVAEERLDAHDDELAGLGDEMESVGAQVEALSEDLDDLAGDFEGLSTDVTGLESDLERVEGGLPDTDVDERLASLESDVEDVESFTSNLKSVFQG